jgi:hypothetical protein
VHRGVAAALDRQMAPSLSELLVLLLCALVPARAAAFSIDNVKRLPPGVGGAQILCVLCVAEEARRDGACVAKCVRSFS